MGSIRFVKSSAVAVTATIPTILNTVDLECDGPSEGEDCTFCLRVAACFAALRRAT
jgi:hypothetical protein